MAAATAVKAASKLQAEISRRVKDTDDFGEIRRVCAVDVAYSGKTAFCSAVVTSPEGEVVETAESRSAITAPYIPGYLMLRESPPAIKTLKKLAPFDLLLVDGHGRLHPRRCGLACHLGVKLDKPTIGIAKSLLCGKTNADGSVELDGQILGQEIRYGSRALYVSVGHRVSLGTAVSLIEKFGRGGMPPAMKLADAMSKMQKRKGRV